MTDPSSVPGYSQLWDTREAAGRGEEGGSNDLGLCVQRARMAVQHSCKPYHVGLPGVGPPIHAQDAVGNRDPWNPGMTQSSPTINTIPPLAKFQVPLKFTGASTRDKLWPPTFPRCFPATDPSPASPSWTGRTGAVSQKPRREHWLNKLMLKAALNP